VWSPEGAGVHVSTTLGSSWTATTGLPQGARVEADRVNPETFYAVHAGTFYTSTDGGETFTASAATGLPAEGNVRLAAVPGHEGDVWLAGGETDGTYGMWRSTDSGATFEAVEGVDEGDSIGFGKGAPGSTYPSVYTSSKIDGVRGIFRSDDAGASWTRINDDEHQWAWTGSTITGDPDVHGRVYVGTNGRGIVVGDAGDFVPTDPEPTPDPTDDPTEEPTDEPTEEPTEEPTDEPTDPAPGATCEVAYTTSDWNTGFTASVRITNTGTTALSGWSLEFVFPAGQQVIQAWSSEAGQSGDRVTLTNAAWNGTLAPGASTTVGFNGSHSGTNTAPDTFTVNGTTCD
jgi:xyloglucan-specific exo-beta-1,4-glucanase